jgi:hypothetical protein
MTKLNNAKQILRALGMPPQQTNDNAAYTLLAFAGIGPRTPWSEASAPRLNPHGVLEFLRKTHNKDYAENTRETIRRQAIHQFLEGGLLARNPGAPDLPTNSPRTHYALSDEALRAIRAYGEPRFDEEVAGFLRAVGGGLVKRYAKQRVQRRVPVLLPDGTEIQLSPGGHNRLQAAVVTDFIPQFVEGPNLLYLGDSDDRLLVHDSQSLRALGVPISKHDKLPDIVVHDTVRDWLFLIEAVTSHGPISPTRQHQLEKALKKCRIGLVFVSAFLDFKEFKRHAQSIAWDTEVWLAEAPSHLLHYNGDRFMGPR